MNANRTVALPKPEALLALSDSAARIYRQLGDDQFIIQTDLSDDRAAIVVTAWFPQGEPSDQAEVRMPLPPEGWNAMVDYRIRHEFIHVVKKRLDLEQFIADYVRSKMMGVIDAYRH